MQLEAQSYPSIAMTLHTALIVVVPKFCDANDWWWSGFMTNMTIKWGILVAFCLLIKGDARC